MKTKTIDLEDALRLHRMWTVGDAGGKQLILSWADLSGANLSVADLSEADLSGANLSMADLSVADLSGADLSAADLSRVTLCGATIDGARVNTGDLGGPGHILAALTDSEWDLIQKQRQ